jgi:tetratricopeptide (TPR) repeat protein
VPRWIGRVVLRGLAAAPGDRYPSMADLLHALRRDPHRRLRRAAAVLVAAATVALAFAVAPLLRAPGAAGPSCGAAAAERVAAVWGPANHQRVERAFTATGKPFAAAAYAEVARVLDGHARHWTELRSDLCETERDRREPAEQLASLRALCLDNRLSDLRGFVAQLKTASADMVQRAAGAAPGLVNLDECANPRALLGPVPPPADPAARARIAALRDQLADAKALHRLGRFAEARERARGLLDAVRATHDRPLEAETQLAIGMAAFESGDYDGVEPALNAAVFAAEAGRSDAVQIRALLYVMYYQGVLQSHYEQAARDVPPRIQAALERLGGDAELEGNLHVVLSWTWLGASHFADAEREGKRALELLEQRFGPSDIRIAPALYTRIRVALAHADTATAVALAERLLAIRIRVNGDDHPETAAAHQLFGLAVEHTQRAGDARDAFVRAEAIYDRTLGPDHPEMADVYGNIASYDAAMGRMAEALSYDRHMLAIVEKTSGTQSRQYGEARLATAERLADLDRDSEALAALDQAQAALGASVAEDSIQISDQRLTLAIVLGHVGRYAEARRDAEASLAILGRLLGPAHPSNALRHRALGEIDLATRRPGDALAAFERARETIDRNDGSLARVRADIDFGIARALAALDRDPQRARALAESARAVYAGYPELAARLRRIEAWLAPRTPRPATATSASP